QNGLGNYEILADHVGHERVTAGVIYVGAAMVDGRLRATGPGKIELGRPESAAPRAWLEELASLLGAGGMDVTVVDDPWPSVWRKVVTNAAVNPLTALMRKTNADLLADPAAALVADGRARDADRFGEKAEERGPDPADVRVREVIRAEHGRAPSRRRGVHDQRFGDGRPHREEQAEADEREREPLVRHDGDGQDRGAEE